MGDTFASVWIILPQMRPVALTIPAAKDGGWSVFGSTVRPSASAHCPTRASFFGYAAGTGRSFASTFRSVSIRLWSWATTLATSRVGRPGTVTKMSVGLLAKLNELVTTYPSAATTSPVVGPTPRRIGAPGGRPGRAGGETITSTPPDVSILTTLGATRAVASFIAFSIASLRSAADAGGGTRARAKVARNRHGREVGGVMFRPFRFLALWHRSPTCAPGCTGRRPVPQEEGPEIDHPGRMVTASWPAALPAGSAAAGGRRASARPSAARRRGGPPAGPSSPVGCAPCGTPRTP